MRFKTYGAEYATAHHDPCVYQANEVEPQGDDEDEVDGEVVREASVREDVGEVDGVGHHEEPRAEGGEVVTGTYSHRRVGAYYLLQDVKETVENCWD